MLGRKPIYDNILLNLKVGDSFDKCDGLNLTKLKIEAIRKRAIVLGIKLQLRTIAGVPKFTRIG